LRVDYAAPDQVEDDEALWIPDWDDEEAPGKFKEQLQQVMAEQAKS
jgi:hypothetical protein